MWMDCTVLELVFIDASEAQTRYIMQIKQMYKTDLSLTIVITNRVGRYHLALSLAFYPIVCILFGSWRYLGIIVNRWDEVQGQIKNVLSDLDDIYLEIYMCRITMSTFFSIPCIPTTINLHTYALGWDRKPIFISINSNNKDDQLNYSN